MQLRYVLATLAILAAAVITGCASNQNTEPQVTRSTQSRLIEEYYLKPTTGSDAARLDTLEQEIIAANTRKVDLVRKDHIIDLRTKVAQEDLVFQRNRTPLLKANLNFAVGKNDDDLVKKAEAELKANQDEIENKQCIIEYLKPRKDVNKDEIALVDAELAAKVAEREYIRAKVARDNQDELLGPPKTDDDETKDTTIRINVEEFKNTMKARQLEQKEVKKTHAQNAGRLNATESCGFDEKDLDTPPQQIRFEQQQQQQNQQQQQQQNQQQQQKKQTNNQPVQQPQQQVQIVAAGTYKIKLTESQK